MTPTLTRSFLALALLAGGGFLGKLMYDMTRDVHAMAGHVGDMSRHMQVMSGNLDQLSRDMRDMRLQVTEINRHVGEMAGQMAGMGQTIQQSGETLQRWNPMQMLTPAGK
jgi:methyl-accepting chemotaxis protein